MYEYIKRQSLVIDKEIKRAYEELEKRYGKKQPARNIASVVKDVPISDTKGAEGFLGIITKEKSKKYNAGVLFKNTKVNISKENESSKSLIEFKEKWYDKIFNFAKKLFKKIK